jgi:L-fuculose-phosphate aldolase
MNSDQRQAVIEAARAMNASGINQGTSGNLSVRSGDGMLITPTGMDYASLANDDIAFVGASGKVEGSRKPSSEWQFHHDIYRFRPDAQAILHAHPANCTTLACLRKPMPAFHYMVAVAGGKDIRCADYATFGTRELSDKVLTALMDRKACLMANHGLVCLGDSLQGVLALAIEIENLAKIYLQTLSVGGPTILDDEEMSRVVEKFKSYGDQNAR